MTRWLCIGIANNKVQAFLMKSDMKQIYLHVTHSIIFTNVQTLYSEKTKTKIDFQLRYLKRDTVVYFLDAL